MVSLVAGHWQNKLYPYGATGQTLGDGILQSIGMPVDYWWCWLAIGVSIAYILLLNAVIVILLTVLPGPHTYLWVLYNAACLTSTRLACASDKGPARDKGSSPCLRL